MAISMLKIRRPLRRLIFTMGIAIPGKTVFLIETAPGKLTCHHCNDHFQQKWTIVVWTNWGPSHKRHCDWFTNSIQIRLCMYPSYQSDRKEILHKQSRLIYCDRMSVIRALVLNIHIKFGITFSGEGACLLTMCANFMRWAGGKNEWHDNWQ